MLKNPHLREYGLHSTLAIGNMRYTIPQIKILGVLHVCAGGSGGALPFVKCPLGLLGMRGPCIITSHDNPDYSTPIATSDQTRINIKLKNESD